MLSKCDSVAVYRKWDSKWYGFDDAVIDDRSTISALEATIRRQTHWRRSASKTSYFPLTEHHAVASMDFPRPASTARRDTIQALIEKIIQRAGDSYDANHDELTGLLNRRGLDRTIQSSFSQNSSTCSVVLDLDHFKQINDKFGHAYGDMVLTVAADRLQKTCASLKESKLEITKIVIARTGGEEFAVVFQGDLNKRIRQEVAEGLKQGIFSNILPTGAEAAPLLQAHGLRADLLPPRTRTESYNKFRGFPSNKFLFAVRY